jgi:hypothetical protein
MIVKSNNLRTQPGFQKHGAAGFQIVVISGFDGAFTFVVYNPGALLCLKRGVVAGIDEGFNHVVKGVDIVIKQNNLIVLLFVSKNINFYLYFLFGAHSVKIINF